MSNAEQNEAAVMRILETLMSNASLGRIEGLAAVVVLREGERTGMQTVFTTDGDLVPLQAGAFDLCSKLRECRNEQAHGLLLDLED